MHYNWHRSYDPSLGRYTQPDPLGFVDGASVFGYGRSRPILLADPTGRSASNIRGAAAAGGALCPVLCPVWAGAASFCLAYPDACRKGFKACIDLFSKPPPPDEGSDEKSSAPPKPRIDPSDPESFKDRTPQEVKDALTNNPDLTGPLPTRDGNGARWTVNGTKGADQVIINNGYPDGLQGGGGDSIHEGPYAKIATRGRIIRVPLKRN